MDFEKAMARLAEIADAMGGELHLEESVKLYTEAAELIKLCREHIQKARLRVETLEASPEE